MYYLCINNLPAGKLHVNVLYDSYFAYDVPYINRDIHYMSSADSKQLFSNNMVSPCLCMEIYSFNRVIDDYNNIDFD